MVCGSSDSSIKVFWLNSEKVKDMLGLTENQNSQLNSEGLKVRLYSELLQSKGQSSTMLKSRQAHLLKKVSQGVMDARPDQEEAKIIQEMSECELIGHSGAVYATSISIDDKFLVSGSADSTIRLWSLLTRSCLVVYLSHQFAVWDVKFSPLGYYFASASNDRTACVWNMKQHTPVRVLAGHLSDVTCVEWLPNAHYVATGSTDSQIRLWSVETGECVRDFFTFDHAVRSLKFSRSGLILIAGNDVGVMVIFDVQAGCAIEVVQTCQNRAIWQLDVSWDDTLIAIGTEMGTIELYNIKAILRAAELKKSRNQFDFNLVDTV